MEEARAATLISEAEAAAEATMQLQNTIKSSHQKSRESKFNQTLNTGTKSEASNNAINFTTSEKPPKYQALKIKNDLIVLPPSQIKTPILNGSPDLSGVMHQHTMPLQTRIYTSTLHKSTLSGKQVHVIPQPPFSQLFS